MVEMPPPFPQLSLEEFKTLLDTFAFTRVITEVHMHHTYRPNHAQYKGHATIQGMWRVHAIQLRYRDIAQHISIAPDGTIWMGRNWNWSPASSPGANGTDEQGPFMFETIGDFNRGKDVLKGAQLETVIQVITAVQRRFGLPPEALRFHRQLIATDCPGRAVQYETILETVRAAHQAAEQVAEQCAEARATEGIGPDGILTEEAFLDGDDAEPPSAARPDIEAMLAIWSGRRDAEPEPPDAGCVLHTEGEEGNEAETTEAESPDLPAM